MLVSAASADNARRLPLPASLAIINNILTSGYAYNHLQCEHRAHIHTSWVCRSNSTFLICDTQPLEDNAVPAAICYAEPNNVKLDEHVHLEHYSRVQNYRLQTHLDIQR
jgi:hypothetical protein